MHDNWIYSYSYILVYNRKKDSFRSLGFEKGVPRGKITHINHNSGSIFAGSINGVVEIDRASKAKINSPIEKFIFSRNLFVADIEKFQGDMFFVLSNKVFKYDNVKNDISALNWKDGTFDISLKNNQIEIASRSVSKIFSRENNLYIITDLGVIDYNEGSMIVPSSLYFNYKVTDLVIVDNYLLFLSTSRGLAIIDMETKELINYYDFSFLRNIYQMKYISEYLVLLTSKGLIKFNFNLWNIL